MPVRPARTARRTTRAAWSRHTERVSRERRDVLAPDAIARYDAIDDDALKLALAREIAISRGSEFTHAYRNVVMVAAGHKRKRRGRAQALVDVPCVVFIVRRKVTKSKLGPKSPQLLPRHVLAFTDWQGERVLVAVPTDVQEETVHAAARAQADNAIYVETRPGEFGAIAALVEVRQDAVAMRCALSPLHVLTPGGRQARSAVGVQEAIGNPQPPTPRFGRTSGIGGHLAAGPAPSFDAQLVQEIDEDKVREMLGDMPLDPREPFVANRDRLMELVAARSVFSILVPDNHPSATSARAPIGAKFSQWMDQTMSVAYGMRNAPDLLVHHPELLALECQDGEQTWDGDSGSPVVIFLGGGTCTLAGMHLSGAANIAHMLPAWVLFDPANWNAAFPPGATISPLPNP